jgi:hypothetical protein
MEVDFEGIESESAGRWGAGGHVGFFGWPQYIPAVLDRFGRIPAIIQTRSIDRGRRRREREPHLIGGAAMKPLLPIATLSLALLAAPAMASQEPFTRIADMTAPRMGHTATRLLDGRVLVAGGDASGRSAELYDPATGTFVETGRLIEPRGGHTATLLPDGSVLIAGGDRMVEHYDPAAGSFSPGPRTHMSVATATLLADGRVLLAGDLETELYDPLARVSRPAARFLRPGPWLEIYYDAATRLADGRVLFTGFGPSQLYDPASDRFTVVGPPDLCDLAVCGLEMHSATLLPNGKVLVAGGMNDEFTIGTVDLAELFNPATNAFEPGGKLIQRRYTHAAVGLANGRVLIVGGSGVKCDVHDCYPGGSLAFAEIYDPASGAFLAAGEMKVSRVFPRATRLENGDVLVTGGSKSCGMFVNCYEPRLASAELYRAGTASTGKTLMIEYENAPLDRYFMTADPDELVLMEGGRWPGWRPSGSSFGVSTAAAEGLDPVCAFSPRRPPGARAFALRWPIAFYTVEPEECAAFKAQYGWKDEGVAFFAARVRDGECPPGMRILWRAFNNYGYPTRQANHRYSTDRGALEAMTARGWSVQGAAMCVE